MLIWVYGLENMEFYVNVLNPIRKALFSRLPMSLLKRLAYIPASSLWLLLRIGFQPIEYFRLLRAFPLAISITLFSIRCCRRLRTIGRAIPSRN